MVEPPPAFVDRAPADNSNKKRRLSRREQKARRKKQKKCEANNSTVRSSPPLFNNVSSTVKPVDDDPLVVLRSRRNIDASSSSKDEDDDYRSTYVPTPIPTAVDEECVGDHSSTTKEYKARKHQQQPTVGAAAKSLGKWFPSAVKLKSTSAPNITRINASASLATCSLLLFYQYATPPWNNTKMRLLMRYLVHIHQHRHGNLGGRIRISTEGLNATVSAVDLPASSAAATLRHFAQDLIHFDPATFTQTDFKYTDQLQADRHFCQLNLLPVKELVYYGLDERMAPLAHGGTHVSPQQFHQYLAGADDKDTVVIDVRNHYEAAIGRFDGQQHLKQEEDSSNNGSKPRVATYVDPKMRKSTDWASWLAQPETRELLSDKRVLLFCTGGIRCERASAHLNRSYLTSSSELTTTDRVSDRKPAASSSWSTKPNDIPPPAEVFQLQGGIERYLKAFPDGGFWRGKNYVFDKREAVSADDPNGDGGVIRRTQRRMDSVTTEDCVCVACNKPWDRYIGKQHCRCCGVPVLCCDACLSSTTTKISTLPMRCPLCVEQNITVPAEDVVYTKNGVAAVSINPVTNKQEHAKAAPSVCKWGGGHAVEKRRKRQLQNRPCRFGADCQRPGCFFAHPVGLSHANVKK